MSWKDQNRRRRQAQKRGRRSTRRAVSEALRRVFGPAARMADAGHLPAPDDDDGQGF